MTRDQAIEAISTYFDEGTFQAELANLVSYETATRPLHRCYRTRSLEPHLLAPTVLHHLHRGT